MNFLLPAHRWPLAAALIAVLIAVVACTSSETGGVDSAADSTGTTGTAPPSSTPTDAGASALTPGEPDVLATQTPTAISEAISGAIFQPAAASNRIAFASVDGAVYTVNPDGSGRRRISNSDPGLSGSPFGAYFTWPSWSPDGRYLLTTAFTSDISGGFETSLLRTAVDPPGAASSLLFRDIPGSTGIGGVAHFPIWRPDSKSVALIANVGDGLSTFLIDVEKGIATGISNGAPVYLDWSSDGARLLVHTAERLVLYEFDSTGSRTAAERIGVGSVSYRVPKFSPVSDDYLYVDFAGDIRGLFKGSPGVPDAELITEARANSAISWAPDGDRVAFADGSRAGFYESLRLIDLTGVTAEVTLDTPVLAFWWSPDGQRLLVALPGGERDNAALAVVDSRTGDVNLLGLIEPSPEMGFVISFFDQYAADLQLWSPDSSRFVFSGLLKDGLIDDQAGTPVQLSDGEPGVWVFDPSGARPPLSLGAGMFGTWSPG